MKCVKSNGDKAARLHPIAVDGDIAPHQASDARGRRQLTIADRGGLHGDAISDVWVVPQRP